MVAAMGVRHERFAAVGRPFDRAVELLGGPGQCDILCIKKDLGTESATDIRRNHAHLVLGQAQHEGRHQQALDVRVLVGDIQRVLVVRPAERADGRAGLHRIGDQAVVGQVELGDVCSGCKNRIHRGLVAQRPLVAMVVRRGLVQGGCPGGVGHAHHGRQHVVVHLDRLGCIARLLQRVSNDHCHVIAHVPHLAQRQHGMRRLFHRRAIGGRDEPAARQAPHLSFKVLAGEDPCHAGHRRRRAGVDRVDRGMRVRRSHEDRIALVGQVDVVGVLA